MKEDIINIVRILGIGANEIILDIDLGFIVINSLEVRDGDLFLHSFYDDDLDYEFELDDLDESQQRQIWILLSTLLYN